MLIVITGTDVSPRNVYVEKLLDDLQKKRKQASVAMVEAHDGVPDTLTELIGTPGLYDEKRIIVLKNLTDKTYDNQLGYKEWRDWFSTMYDELASSEHAFIFVADEVNACVKKLQSAAASSKDFTKKAVKAARDGSVFAFTDAFVNKDKKTAWQNYHELLQIKKVPEEEVVGLLVWQLKALLEVMLVSNQKDSTLSSFVYNKTKRAARNWNQVEIKNLLLRLLELSSGEEREELSLELERMVLEL